MKRPSITANWPPVTRRMSSRTWRMIFSRPLLVSRFTQSTSFFTSKAVITAWVRKSSIFFK